MRDILTRLTFSLGERMSTNETNELYESAAKKSQAGWKLDVVKEFVTTHADESDVCNKAVELATLLGVDKYEKGTTLLLHIRTYLQEKKHLSIPGHSLAAAQPP